MDQSITNEVSFQYMTPVNGDNEIDFVNRIRIQRDPETQYLIKAIKKELQRFRTTYSRDYSIV